MSTAAAAAVRSGHGARRDHVTLIVVVIGEFFSRDCHERRVTRTLDHSVYTDTSSTTTTTSDQRPQTSAQNDAAT